MNINCAGGWAMVELFRHQHGELPQPDDRRTLDYELASAMMGAEVASGTVAPFSAAQVIALLGRKLQRARAVVNAAKQAEHNCRGDQCDLCKTLDALGGEL